MVNNTFNPILYYKRIKSMTQYTQHVRLRPATKYMQIKPLQVHRLRVICILQYIK